MNSAFYEQLGRIKEKSTTELIFLFESKIWTENNTRRATTSGVFSARFNINKKFHS